MKDNVVFEKFTQLNAIPADRKKQMMERLQNAPDWLLEHFSVSVLEAGVTVVYEGQPVTHIFYPIDGIIKATDYRVYGIEFDFARFTRVYALGAMEVLMDHKTYRTTLKTVDRCIILKIKKEWFDKWMREDINALRYESKMMGEYLLEQGRRARSDLLLPGPERLAMLFVRKYDKYSKDGVLQLSMTRQDLSNETGFTIKTISRAIKSLTEDGYITKCEKYYIVDALQYQRMKSLLETIVASETEGIIRGY